MKNFLFRIFKICADPKTPNFVLGGFVFTLWLVAFTHNEFIGHALQISVLAFAFGMILTLFAETPVDLFFIILGSLMFSKKMDHEKQVARAFMEKAEEIISTMPEEDQQQCQEIIKHGAQYYSGAWSYAIRKKRLFKDLMIADDLKRKKFQPTQELP